MLVENGEKLHLAPDLETLAKSEQREALESDEREGLVREYLETLLPEDWDGMDLFDRRSSVSYTHLPKETLASPLVALFAITFLM